METYTDYKQLRAALKRLKPFTDSRPNLPIMAYVKLDSRDGKLRLTGPKAETGQASFTTATVNTAYNDYSVLVKYKDFRKVIDKVKADVEITVNGLNLQLKSGSLTFTLLGKDTENFPCEPKLTDRVIQVSSSITYRDLRDELDFVSRATESNSSQNYTTGILFDYSQPDRLRLIGTDGRRLHSTYVKSHCHSITESPDNYLVPVEWVKAFNSLKPNPDETVYIEFCEGDRMFWTIPNESISGTVSLMDTPYPDYEKVIPDDCESRFQLDTKATLESLNAVSIIANELDGRDMVVVNANGTLNLSANAESMGKATAEVPCNHLEGPEATFALNVNYFIETLKLAGNEITMSNSGSLEPARFDYPDTNRIAVVMPVRLPE